MSHSPESGSPRILVTGAGGFIGRALVARLAAVPGVDATGLTLVDISLPDAPAQAACIEGDLADPAILAAALDASPDVIFHLASLPGGAAEADFGRARQVNLDAPLALFEGLAGRGDAPRVVYASSVAVFGAPLPAKVDDATLPAPGLTYGAHKLMAEIALADFVRRGRLRGLALRLPGIVARPRQAGGFRSAFMSDIFHAVANGEPFEMPVGSDATAWLMSRRCCIDNLIHAAGLKSDLATPTAITLPVVRASMGQLAARIARVAGKSAKVSYAPDLQLEMSFGRQPPLSTAAADSLGFRSDGDIDALATTVLEDLGLTVDQNYARTSARSPS